MKKQLLTILTLIIFTNIFSQSYDNATTLIVIDKTHVLARNNQHCATPFEVELLSGRTWVTPVVQPDSSTIITLDICCIVSVTPLVDCSEITPGTVRVNSCDFVLGVSGITTFEANRTNKGVEIILKLASEDNVGKVEILTSPDRKIFTPVIEFKPDGRLVYYPIIPK